MKCFIKNNLDLAGLPLLLFISTNQYLLMHRSCGEQGGTLPVYAWRISDKLVCRRDQENCLWYFEGSSEISSKNNCQSLNNSRTGKFDNCSDLDPPDWHIAGTTRLQLGYKIPFTVQLYSSRLWINPRTFWMQWGRLKMLKLTPPQDWAANEWKLS